MGKYSIVIGQRAQKELQSLHKSGNTASIKKIKQIFEELKEHPQTGIGQPGPLKYNMSGYWSQRINQKDRLIYRIDPEVTFLVSAQSFRNALRQMPTQA